MGLASPSSVAGQIGIMQSCVMGGSFFMVPVVLQKGSGGRNNGFVEIPALLEQETSQGRTLGTAKLITNYWEGNPHQKKCM